MHKYTCSKKVQILQTADGRGSGLFARNVFNVGDELVRESPTFTAPNSRQSLKLFAELPEAKQKVVMGLSDAHNPEPTVWGVLKTNCIPLGESNSSNPSANGGIFPLACRLNHACAPNARYVWRADLGKELVFAIRPIAIGEELTVQYNETYCPLAERQKYFQAHFNFTCECKACVNASDESDARLREIKELIDAVPTIAQRDPARALKASERTLRVMKEEGRDTPLDRLSIHYDAYQVAKAANNRRKAMEHLRLAWECAKLSSGPTSEQATRYERMLK